MGCLVFIISFMGLFLVYSVIGGVVGQYIVEQNHITGVDTKNIFMPVFLYYVPLATFLSSMIIAVVFSVKRQQHKEAED